jgi:hypothetical protein
VNSRDIYGAAGGVLLLAALLVACVAHHFSFAPLDVVAAVLGLAALNCAGRSISG